MHFSQLKLKNWRNFTQVELPFGHRIFITGPNASGKSNLMDAFRFLRDIAKTGGGLHEAVTLRGGLAKLRCLAARRNPNVEIEVEVRDGRGDNATVWRYGIGLKQESRGMRRVLLSYEKVWKNDILILNRPDQADESDGLRLTETHLEQITANRAFHPLAEVFQKILYLHLIPQLLKFPQLANRDVAGDDPFGIKFLDRLMETPEKTRRSRLRKIESALRIAVPEFEEKSPRRVLRKSIVRRDSGGNLRQGPAYNSTLAEFVNQHWNPEIACSKFPSLSRIILALSTFEAKL